MPKMMFVAGVVFSLLQTGCSIRGSILSLTPQLPVRLNVPVLNVIPSRTFAAQNPLPAGSRLNFKVGNQTGDTGMTYTCAFDRIIDGAVQLGANCNTLPGSATFTQTGGFSWTPSLLAYGAYEIELRGTNADGTATEFVSVDILNNYSQTNLVFNFDAQFVDGISQGKNSALLGMMNLVPGGMGLTLPSSFNGSPQSGWVGNGSRTNPYGLSLTGSNYNQVTGPLLSDTSYLASIWVKLTGLTTDDNVILSSGGKTGTGFSLSQSALNPGKVSLQVGGLKSWVETQPTTPRLLAGFRLNETTGLYQDFTGNGNSLSDFGSAVTRGSQGALNSSGDTDLAVTLSGSPNTGLVSSQNVGSPQTLSWEVWFKTAPGYAQGGKMVGLGSSSNFALSSDYDRQVYMDNAGHVYFGVYCGATFVAASPLTYNDGNWHYAAATFDANGLLLYVDGQLVATHTGRAPYTAYTFQSFIHVGNDNMRGWPATPSSNNFAGSIDEIYLWSDKLTSDQILARYNARGCESQTTLAANTFYQLSVRFDQSTSTASLYVNGVNECSMVMAHSSQALASQALSIGAEILSAGAIEKYFTGVVSDLKYYNRSGADSDVLSLYNALKVRFP